MVDEGIKKVTIKSAEFPYIQFKTTTRGANIATAAVAGTTVSYATKEKHALTPGDTVTISGILPTAFNLSSATVATVPTETTFTITATGVTGTYTSGGFLQSVYHKPTPASSPVLRTYIGDLYYNFRYRIVSDDKNRFSYWSPTKQIVMPDVGSGTFTVGGITYPYFPYTDPLINISKNGDVVTTIWNKKTDTLSTEFEKIFTKIGVFDIWIRWNTSASVGRNHPDWSDWEHRTTVSSNSYSIINPQPTVFKMLDIAIQVPTTNKVRDYSDGKLTLFRSTANV